MKIRHYASEKPRFEHIYYIWVEGTDEEIRADGAEDYDKAMMVLKDRFPDSVVYVRSEFKDADTQSGAFIAGADYVFIYQDPAGVKHRAVGANDAVALVRRLRKLFGRSCKLRVVCGHATDPRFSVESFFCPPS